MKLADRVDARRRDAVRAAEPVTEEEFALLLGQSGGGVSRTRSGITVGPAKALTVSSWWRGVRYLTETMAGLPVDTYRDLAGGERALRADPAWKAQPDVETPWFSLVEGWMMSLLHRGNAYSFKLRNPAGQVTGLRPLHPDRVRVGQASDGTKMFEIDGRRDIGFTRREVHHIPGLSYNGIVGLDVITYMAESLGRAAAANEYASKSFGEGNHLQAYISLPEALTDDEADLLQAQWSKFHKGMLNSHEFGVLGNGAEYKTVSLTPEQQQLLQTRQFETLEVARFLGVVPHKLYDLSRATFSNIEHQAIEAVVDGIRPWATRIEAFTNFDRTLLPARNKIEFQLEGLLRGDSAARAAYYAAAINAGWMQPARAARLENEPAPAELEYWLRPLNMAVLRPGQGELLPVAPDKAPAAPEEEA